MRKTQFTPVDAARVALSTPPAATRPAQLRVVLSAAVLWSRELQFPTVRDVAADLGLRSPSSVLSRFETVLDLHAMVIGLEWRRLEDVWTGRMAPPSIAALVDHAQELVTIDRACLRLPALVWAAVTAAEPSRALQQRDLAGPVHALAALVNVPASALGVGALHRWLVATAASFPQVLAVPA